MKSRLISECIQQNTQDCSPKLFRIDRAEKLNDGSRPLFKTGIKLGFLEDYNTMQPSRLRSKDNRPFSIT
jgi:hypothetical protein